MYPDFLSGCTLSPIPKDFRVQRDNALAITAQIQPLLQSGDILFRQGNTDVGGIDFSKLISKSSDSDFSHAVIIHKIIDGEAILANISIHGMQRYFLVDWLAVSQRNLVVKRLKPEYQFLLPAVLSELDALVKADPIYDEKFAEDDDAYYCTEAVDHCFRAAGLPLADKIRIRDFPSYDKVFLIVAVGEMLTDLDADKKVVIAGNDKIGLFSSPYLETVVDLR